MRRKRWREYERTSRGVLPGERGGDHRPVQQETGDQEEHLHAGVHPREVVADHPRVVRERAPARRGARTRS